MLSIFVGLDAKKKVVVAQTFIETKMCIYSPIIKSHFNLQSENLSTNSLHLQPEGELKPYHSTTSKNKQEIWYILTTHTLTTLNQNIWYHFGELKENKPGKYFTRSAWLHDLLPKYLQAEKY